MQGSELKSIQRHKFIVRLKKHRQLYLFVLPAVIYLAIFHYAPIYGVIIAFKNYRPHLGYFGSEWVGLDNIMRFIRSNKFGQVLPNTILISLYQLIAGFPFAIILALCLNYVPSLRYKKLVQNITYAPYFISTVVLVSMLQIFFSQSTGLVNNFRDAFGLDRILYLGNQKMFRPLYVWSGVWQSTGWNSIIYIAALANVDYSQHEAAVIDGASILQRIRFVDLPAITPTIATLFILNTGRIMSVGFEKAYLMQNDLNIMTSELISTYVYKMGIMGQQFSYSTSIDLFNSVINLMLVFIANFVSRRLSETSLW